jgi:hypothetical protein
MEGKAADSLPPFFRSALGSVFKNGALKSYQITAFHDSAVEQSETVRFL